MRGFVSSVWCDSMGFTQWDWLSRSKSFLQMLYCKIFSDLDDLGTCTVTYVCMDTYMCWMKCLIEPHAFHTTQAFV